jgi:Protein of unknown function (DUF3553)
MSGFKPGDRVVLQSQPDWGPGQVQSAIGDRLTVNFENAGKQTLNARFALLKRLD